MTKTILIISFSMFSFLMNLFGSKANAQANKNLLDTGIYSKTDTTLFYPPYSSDALGEIHFEAAKFLWQNYVPKSGQAATVQGELIRAAERLEHEIRDNGKLNWNPQFVMLGEFLKETLIRSGVFPEEAEKEIREDITLLIRDNGEVITEATVYTRITRRIVEWYWRHKEPVKHPFNPKLKI